MKMGFGKMHDIHFLNIRHNIIAISGNIISAIIGFSTKCISNFCTIKYNFVSIVGRKCQIKSYSANTAIPIECLLECVLGTICRVSSKYRIRYPDPLCWWKRCFSQPCGMDKC